VFTTNGTYPWLFVTQIVYSGQLNHGGDFIIMNGESCKLVYA